MMRGDERCDETRKCFWDVLGIDYRVTHSARGCGAGLSVWDSPLSFEIKEDQRWRELGSLHCGTICHRCTTITA